jgi:hypothetical protein
MQTNCVKLKSSMNSPHVQAVADSQFKFHSIIVKCLVGCFRVIFRSILFYSESASKPELPSFYVKAVTKQT